LTRISAVLHLRRRKAAQVQHDEKGEDQWVWS
jgi:hypothetical protein